MPGILLGAVGGLIIGVVIAPLRHRLSPGSAALIGLLVAALIVLSAHLVLGRGLIESHQVGLARFIPYLFWLAGPSVLIISGLTWVGWSTLAVSSKQQAGA